MDKATAFWARVAVGDPGECWEWQRARHDFGYGMVHWDGRMTTAHRVAYVLGIGPIPQGALIRHDCDNPPCCNPAHLRAGTIAENQADMALRERSAAGERHPAAKLSAADVQAIRAEHAAGGQTHEAIAARYGIARNSVTRIVNRTTWKRPRG